MAPGSQSPKSNAVATWGTVFGTGLFLLSHLLSKSTQHWMLVALIGFIAVGFMSNPVMKFIRRCRGEAE
jgi:hypothetical protein